MIRATFTKMSSVAFATFKGFSLKPGFAAQAIRLKRVFVVNGRMLKTRTLSFLRLKLALQANRLHSKVGMQLLFS